MFNGLGLFAGIGGLELGLERAGLCNPVCFVENDKYAQKVLKQRFPETSIWDDVATFDGKPWKGIIDVISGGFPCQDVSNNGKRAGIDGVPNRVDRLKCIGNAVVPQCAEYIGRLIMEALNINE